MYIQYKPEFKLTAKVSNTGPKFLSQYHTYVPESCSNYVPIMIFTGSAKFHRSAIKIMTTVSTGVYSREAFIREWCSIKKIRDFFAIHDVTPKSMHMNVTSQLTLVSP